MCPLAAQMPCDCLHTHGHLLLCPKVSLLLQHHHTAVLIAVMAVNSLSPKLESVSAAKQLCDLGCGVLTSPNLLFFLGK